MIVFFCYPLRDLNRLLGQVLACERAAGGDGVLLGLGRPEVDELRSLGLDPVRFSVLDPASDAVEKEVSDWTSHPEAALGGRSFRGLAPAVVQDVVTRLGAIIPDDDAATVMARTLRILARVDLLITALAPRLLVVWNGTVGVPAAVVAVARARRVPMVFIDRGPLPGLMQVDPEGFNGESSVARAGAPGTIDHSAAEWVDRIVSECLPAITADPVVDAALERGGNGTRRIALFADQLLSDHSRVKWADGDLYACLASAYRGVEGLRLVVKRHPFDREGRGKVIESLLPGSLYVEAGDIRTWIDRAHHVITVDSSVGLLAALTGKPVVMLGPATFGGPGTSPKGITIDVGSRAELDVAARASAAGGAGVARAAREFLSWWRSRGGLFHIHEAGEAEQVHSFLRRFARPAAPSPNPSAAVALLQANEHRVVGLEAAVDAMTRHCELLESITGHLDAPSIRLLRRALRVVGRVRGLRSLAEVLSLLDRAAAHPVPRR